jgi:nitroimidazol reductase NimA-like FMN-containing flavoprotein (pyridoxamine 5'-phosphate oxidase superfamily)
VNAQEMTEYLGAPHIAVVATIGRNGTPHLTPNWYRYDGQVLTLITRTDRLKYLNLLGCGVRDGDCQPRRHPTV